MRFPEKYKVVPVGALLDISAATVDTDSINMKGYHRATFLIQIQGIADAASVLTVNSGATDGAISSALYFTYAYGGAAAGAASCDVLAADTAKVNTLTIATSKDQYLLVVEVDAIDMDTGNEEEWLTLRFTDAGACIGNVTVLAILEPRYTQGLSVTALT